MMSRLKAILPFCKQHNYNTHPHSYIQHITHVRVIAAKNLMYRKHHYLVSSNVDEIILICMGRQVNGSGMH